MEHKTHLLRGLNEYGLCSIAYPRPYISLVKTLLAVALCIVAAFSVHATGVTLQDGLLNITTNLSVGTSLFVRVTNSSSIPSSGLQMGGNGDVISFVGSSGGVAYLDSNTSLRYGLMFPGSNIVALANRASNGAVQIRANTAASGPGGEITVARFEDDEINLLTSGGNVGIGTSNPSHTLEVTGDIYQGGCRSGFTRYGLGCIQTAEEGTGNITLSMEDCYDTYGGRLPTGQELVLAMSNLGLTNETDDIEWTGSFGTSSSACVHLNATSGIGFTFLKDSTACTITYAYRCFLPFTGGT